MSIQNFISDLEQEYLLQNELELFRKYIKDAVFKTFNSKYRSINFCKIRIPPKTRCWYCSKSFNYIKDKRRYRYCSGDCCYLFYYQYNYATICSHVLKRDKSRCQNCFSLAVKVKESYNNLGKLFVNEVSNWEYDHIKEISSFTTLEEKCAAFLDPSNLQVLCKPCHKAKTIGFLERRNRNEYKNGKGTKNRTLVLSTFLDSTI